MNKKLQIRKNIIFSSLLIFILICIIAMSNLSSLKKILMNDIYVNNFDPISSDDKILILAPHPDDEAISSAGIIQKALSAGAKIRIVYLTNGEYNQGSYLIYEKIPLILKGQFVNLGRVRMNEAINAMASLGLKREDLIFLGYPDFGTMDILAEFWDKNKPYSNLLEKISRVPYAECKSPEAPYTGQSILNDLENILKDFKPTKIIVSSPVDLNRDHQALYLFLRVALWDLKNEIETPKFYCFLVHAKNWPIPKGLHSDYELYIPSAIKGAEEDWINSYLTKKEIDNKNEAVSQYVSQIKYNPAFLVSFVRKNELFSVFKDIELDKNSKSDINGSNIINLDKPNGNITGGSESKNLRKLSYMLEDDFLIIRLGLKRKMDEALGISIYLLGYNNLKNFSVMPKIHIDLNLKGISIKDKFLILNNKELIYQYEGNDLILKIPLKLIGNPDYIMSHIKTHSGDLILDDTAWKVLKLKP